MSKRYSGKSFKDSSVMKKAKLSFKEKRKLKREKKRISNVDTDLVYNLYSILFRSIVVGKFRSFFRSICSFKCYCFISNK